MTYDDMGCCIEAAPMGKKMPKKHYPSVHLETKEKLDIPMEGTITFKFVKKSGEWHKKDDGKTRYECRIELKELVRAQKTREKVEKKMAYEETEDALDEIAGEMED
jgi:hypothetical protein